MNRPVYLITGPSGSGKTALASHLSEQELTAIDADSTAGLCYYINKNNKPVPYPQGADAAWWASHSYVWEIDRLKKLISTLEDGTGPVFFCGNAGNIAKAWDMFAAVYYLDLPADIMTTRIHNQKGDANFGQRVDEREQLMRWAEPFKKEMLELGAVTIDATKPLTDVAADILGRVKASSAK